MYGIRLYIVGDLLPRCGLSLFEFFFRELKSILFKTASLKDVPSEAEVQHVYDGSGGTQGSLSEESESYDSECSCGECRFCQESEFPGYSSGEEGD